MTSGGRIIIVYVILVNLILGKDKVKCEHKVSVEFHIYLGNLFLDENLINILKKEREEGIEFIWWRKEEEEEEQRKFSNSNQFNLNWKFREWWVKKSGGKGKSFGLKFTNKKANLIRSFFIESRFKIK